MLTRSRTFESLLTAAVVFFLTTTSTLTVAKKNRNVPHHHRGLLTPYQPGPFQNLKLTAKDEQQLNQGKPVMKQTLPPKEKPEEGGTAICVQDVQAPKQAVWNQILGLPSYTGKVPKVKECYNYVLRKNSDGSSTIRTFMKLGIMPGYSYTNYYDHTFHPQDDSVVWSLDYDKTSDFDDVAGHWHLEEHPSKPDCTRVFYACDIKMRGAVPGPVLNFISKSALKQATSWVKKESEAAPDNQMPTEFSDAVSSSSATLTKPTMSNPASAAAEVRSKRARGPFGMRFSRAQ